MSYIEFEIAPFPTFIKAGQGVFVKGTKHLKRVFTVFDLLYVKSGELFITENNEPFTIKSGQYFILVPGVEHFGHKGCFENTEVYWLHFLLEQEYSIVENGMGNWSEIQRSEGDFVRPAKFLFRIPNYGSIQNVNFVEKLLENVVSLNHQTPDFPLRQQIYFEEFLLQLQKEALNIPTAAEKVVEETLKYIQENYKEDIKMENLAKVLHFHPDYITRCMQKTLGMTPNQYLNYYRISQAKRLLSSTENKMAAISKEVGILDSTYFSKLFKKIEGLSPLEYRNIVNRRKGE
ncbi:AraC family transcriptional regulator [Metabacillus herbersteinensis]|uniref:AraC family transcriptional regulator n=1 Tax=Metabacillus herbersteinensis TaxID=283816 RepID=A0ABV6GEC2_9BACI